jgi:hypothetical protein
MARGVLNATGYSPSDHWGDGGVQKRQPKRRIERNTHTEGYIDDGLVITMTLSKFFSALNDYSGFLNDGERTYISLTDDSGSEIFQFCVNLDLAKNFEHVAVKVCHVESRNSKTNIRNLVACISESDDVIRMDSPRGRFYGYLYPSVTLDLSQE